MELNNISISQFKSLRLPGTFGFQDQIILTNKIEDVELFKYPCRIDAISILVCLQGEIECSINLKKYIVKANGIIVNLPDNIIHINCFKNVTAYALLISPSYMKSSFIDFKLRIDSHIRIKKSPLIYINQEQINSLRGFYSLLKDNMQAENTEQDEIISGLIHSTVFKISSFFSITGKKDSNSDSPSSITPHTQLIYEEFMELLNKYHDKERSVKFYASKCCLTPNYFSEKIKEYSGKTANNWINEYVILEAKTLLKFSKYSIQEIAYRLNFPSLSAFGKYFKLQTGLSPKFYLKKDTAD